MRYREIIAEVTPDYTKRQKARRPKSFQTDQDRQALKACLDDAGIPVEDVDPTLAEYD